MGSLAAAGVAAAAGAAAVRGVPLMVPEMTPSASSIVTNLGASRF